MLQTPNTTTIIAAIGRMTISSQCWQPLPVQLAQSSLTALLAVGSKLLQIGPEIADLLLVAYSKQHRCAWDLGSRIADEFPKSLLAPSDAGVSHSLAIRSVLDCACLAAIKAVELRTQLVLRRLADVVAGLTFSE